MQNVCFWTDKRAAKLSRVLRLSACAALIPVTWGQQSYSRPPSPISPATMAQCDKLQQAYTSLHQRIEEDHANCLKSGSPANSRSLGGPEPAGRCSVPACQHLHNLLHDPLYSGSPDVGACRQAVQAKLNDDKRRQAERDAQKRHEEEDRKAADEIRKMKEYGDKQEREKPQRDAAAKKEAADNQTWHEKHDAQQLQKEQQTKFDHEKRTLDRQQRDERLGLDDLAQRHDAWATREKSRRDRERSIVDAYEKQLDSLNEQDRNAAQDRITKELDQIHEEGQQDKEPKN
jgi:hypothetical protein